MSLTEFVTQRIAEDEAVARGAIASDPERPGSHWQWVTNETDTPVKTSDLIDAQDYQSVSLRTVEVYPTTSGVGPLPAFIISHTEEVAGAGDHITRHDPARVLAECEAKRRIVEAAADATDLDMSVDGDFRVGVRDEAVEPYCGDVILRALAAVYADHEDYLPEWRT